MCDADAAAARRCSTNSPAGLANGTSYFRQIVARNATGNTTASRLSFTTAAVANDTNPTSLSGWVSQNGDWLAVEGDDAQPCVETTTMRSRYANTACRWIRSCSGLRKLFAIPGMAPGAVISDSTIVPGL